MWKWSDQKTNRTSGHYFLPYVPFLLSEMRKKNSSALPFFYDPEIIRYYLKIITRLFHDYWTFLWLFVWIQIDYYLLAILVWLLMDYCQIIPHFEYYRQNWSWWWIKKRGSDPSLRYALCIKNKWLLGTFEKYHFWAPLKYACLVIIHRLLILI